MGADGGSIPDRRDLVRTKGKSEQVDKAALRELFFLCALSKRPLTRPVVLDPLGKLYNKDAVLEFLLDRSRYGDGEQICGYLKSVKDLLNLNLTSNPEYTPPSAATTAEIPSRAPYVCPLSLKEMSGIVPFIALRPCGCVFSESAVRAIIPTLSRGVTGLMPKEKEEVPQNAESITKSSDAGEAVCPNCGNTFDPTLPEAVLPVNPVKAVEEKLLDHLLVTRAAAKANKKRKAAPVDSAIVADLTPTVKVARKDALPVANGHQTSARSSASPAPARPTPPVNSTLHKSVHQKLAEQEQKRLAAQAGMSDAVKAMFLPKDAAGRKTGGAADFFGRTFNRYAA